MDFEKRFARAILGAQKLREESFDHGKADALEKTEAEARDFTECYSLSISQAARKAVREQGFDIRMNEPIYLLCKYTWNDIQNWAKEVLKDD